MRIGHLHRLGLLGLLTSLCACGSGGSGGGVVFAQSGYFRVTHVQAVQAVQTLDNGMPLVAYKPTYVRVFLDGYQGAHGPWRVSARLTVRDVDTNAEHDLFPISFDPNFAITVTPSGSHPDRWNDSE